MSGKLKKEMTRRQGIDFYKDETVEFQTDWTKTKREGRTRVCFEIEQAAFESNSKARTDWEAGCNEQCE